MIIFILFIIILLFCGSIDVLFIRIAFLVIIIYAFLLIRIILRFSSRFFFGVIVIILCFFRRWLEKIL